VGQRSARQQRECVLAVSLLDALNFADHAGQRSVPTDRFEALAGDALQGMFQAVGVLILHVALYALGAQFSEIEGKILPRLPPNYLVVSYAQLNAALLTAETAMRLHHLVFLFRRDPTACGNAIERGAELFY